jgi:hypothetical protein
MPEILSMTSPQATKNVHFLREKKKMFTKMFTLLLDVGFIREVEKPSGPLLGLIVMSH